MPGGTGTYGMTGTCGARCMRRTYRAHGSRTPAVARLRRGCARRRGEDMPGVRDSTAPLCGGEDWHSVTRHTGRSIHKARLRNHGPEIRWHTTAWNYRRQVADRSDLHCGCIRKSPSQRRRLRRLPSGRTVHHWRRKESIGIPSAVSIGVPRSGKPEPSRTANIGP